MDYEAEAIPEEYPEDIPVVEGDYNPGGFQVPYPEDIIEEPSLEEEGSTIAEATAEDVTVTIEQPSGGDVNVTVVLQTASSHSSLSEPAPCVVEVPLGPEPVKEVHFQDEVIQAHYDDSERKTKKALIDKTWLCCGWVFQCFLSKVLCQWSCAKEGHEVYSYGQDDHGNEDLEEYPVEECPQHAVNAEEEVKEVAAVMQVHLGMGPDLNNMEDS